MDDVNRKITLRTLYEEAKTMAGRRQVRAFLLTNAARPTACGQHSGRPCVPPRLRLTVRRGCAVLRVDAERSDGHQDGQGHADLEDEGARAAG